MEESAMARQEAAILPFTRIVRRSRVYRSRRCPTCGTSSSRRSTGVRQLRDLGIDQPVIVEVRYSKHFCPRCRIYFNCPMSDLAEPGSRYTRRVQETAVAKVLVDLLPLEQVQQQMFREFYVPVPPTTLYEWVIRAGKKGQPEARPLALGG
jgi:transposase